MPEDFSLVQRVQFIKELCRGQKVLHLGCTNYPYTDEALAAGMLLHDDLAAAAGELWGIDSDQRGIDTLAAKGTGNIVIGDLEKLDECELSGTFDVIVAGDIIEHLNNPGLFLDGIKRLMSDETRLVITTINAYCGMRFFQFGLRGKRGQSEPVHPDHVAYYSPATLRLLVGRNGMHVEKLLFYDIGSEHRPHNRGILNLINDICVRIAPQWADGVIAVCRASR